MPPRVLTSIALVLWLVMLPALAASVFADDVFYLVRLDNLKVTEGELPAATQPSDWRDWSRIERMQPYVVLDGEGEAFVGQGDNATDAGRGAHQSLCVRTSQPRDLSGRLFMPTGDGNGFRAARFSIPASDASADARDSFFRAQQAHYERLVGREIPGGAWFRFRMNQAQHAQGTQRDENPVAANRRPNRELDDTYALFTGGRAVSENLALEHAIGATKDEPETVVINKITGITVAEIDWAPLVKELQPSLDPLASYVPGDQHAVFFPSFAAAREVAESCDRLGTPVPDALNPRSEDQRIKQRYERQLGLSLSEIAKLLGPALVNTVAITGSDPYFATGTDVAVLFEAKQADALRTVLAAKIELARAAVPNAQKIDQQIEGVQVTGARSPDRAMSSYLATIDDVVVVTNSPVQLARLIKSHRDGNVLAKQPEYIFFRSRYPRGEADDSAFVMLSDATIRRWCGARWRIADSRRTRAAAVMADQVARGIGNVPATQPLPDVSSFGSLEFLTPIVELELEKVTESEKQAYGRWRVDYQTNWRRVFDPIAAKLTTNDKQLALDLSVMPLIWGTEYRQFVEMSRGAAIDPQAADAHGALAHFAVAINPQSNMMRGWGNFARNMAPALQVDPLAWLGPTVSLYFDDDPFWQELAKIEPNQMIEFMTKEGFRLPIGVRIQSNSPMRMVAFITALRAFAEQTAPGMTQWEALKYNEQDYVRVTPSERAKADQHQIENVALYYAATGDALVLTLNEDVMKRSLDRMAARRVSATAPAPSAPSVQLAPQPTTQPWLGSSLAAQVDRKFLDVWSRSYRESYAHEMQRRSWDNLPILNEWKRLFPDQDPVKIHEKYWHSKLTCPGGGEYVWNEQWQTMESTAFGSPSNPKMQPISPPLLDQFRFLNAGITFEEQGLRARAVLDRAPHNSP